MNVEPLAQRDALYAQRFNMRVRACLTWLIPPHAVLILMTALYDQRLTAALAHLAMAGLAFVIVRASRDGVRTIIFSHVYWTFSFATYAYALAHGQLASTGLAAPERSALIALTSQAGLFLAFWLSPSAPPLSILGPDTAGMRRQSVAHIESILLALGLAGMAMKLWHLLPEAYGAALMLLFQVGLAVRILRQERPLHDPVLLLSLVLLTALSVATNERADLMAALLLLVFAVIMAGDRLATPLNLLVAYLGWRLLTVFSAIALSVRWAREAPWHLANLFADRFFSLETLRSLANPLHTHAAARLYERQAELSPFFTALPGGPADLFARLALLPQMEVVVSRIDPTGVRWGDLWAILVSALPSFGQDKLLIFSDVVVWELGLRARDSLGRPMITAEGELFAIGGYAAVALVIPACFLALFWGYRLIARLTGSRVVAILVASQLFVTGIFSTTLLSVMTQSIREPLQLALILLVLTTIAARVSAMKARAPA